MANADRPTGLRPFERILRETPYVAGGTIYPNEAVKMNSSGQIVVAAAGDALRGAAANYATSGQTVLVLDDPSQKFVIQAEGSVAATDVGLNADIVATAGNSSYRQSRMELDAATLATTTAQLRILALSPAIDNAAGSAAKCVVVINEHELRATAGV